MDVGYYGSDRTDRILRERVQDRWMDAYAPIRHLDPVLVVTAVLLTAACADEPLVPMTASSGCAGC